MHADVKTLYRSGNFRVIDYRCRMEPESVSHPEYASSFAISFTRKGHFGYRVHRDAWDVDSRSLLLSNAGGEYVFTHGRDVSDECTIVHVGEALLDEAQRTFWRKQFRPSRTIGTACRFLFPNPVVSSTPDLDVVHRHLYRLTAGNEPVYSSLRADEVLVYLVETVFRLVYGWDRRELPPALETSSLRRHQETVERAKDFMLAHFEEEISLDRIADAAWVSPFHFSRLFKAITGNTAYEYLVRVRLNHAALLLRHTSASVTEVCFASGFNGLSHFSDSFSRYFGASPSVFRGDRESIIDNR